MVSLVKIHKYMARTGLLLVALLGLLGLIELREGARAT